jgi:hypothetical protein
MKKTLFCILSAIHAQSVIASKNNSNEINLPQQLHPNNYFKTADDGSFTLAKPNEKNNYRKTLAQKIQNITLTIKGEEGEENEVPGLAVKLSKLHIE